MSWYYDMTGFKDAAVVKAANDFSQKFRKVYGYPPTRTARWRTSDDRGAPRDRSGAVDRPCAVAAALMKSPRFETMKGPATWRADHQPTFQYGAFVVQGKGATERKDPKWDLVKIIDVYSGEDYLPPFPLSVTRRHRREGGDLPLPPSEEPSLPEEIILETRGVTKRFDGFAAVTGVNYRLRKGSRRGSSDQRGGQTTFFNLLTGCFPHRGTVLYRGADITRIPAHGRVGRGIVRTFQLVSVFDSLTVRENLVLA